MPDYSNNNLRVKSQNDCIEPLSDLRSFQNPILCHRIIRACSDQYPDHKLTECMIGAMAAIFPCNNSLFFSIFQEKSSKKIIKKLQPLIATTRWLTMSTLCAFILLLLLNTVELTHKDLELWHLLYGYIISMKFIFGLDAPFILPLSISYEVYCSSAWIDWRHWVMSQCHAGSALHTYPKGGYTG